jgi:hypothetical protein
MVDVKGSRNRRKATVLFACSLAAGALLCSVYDGGSARQRPGGLAQSELTLHAAQQQLRYKKIELMRGGKQQQQLYESGKQLEQAEAKKLDQLRDPTGGQLKSGEAVEAQAKPMRLGGLGQWLGRGEQPDNNVYGLNYMDMKTNEYYGQGSMSQHGWSPLPDKDTPSSVYYNVLDHWTATDPMADANKAR